MRVYNRPTKGHVRKLCRRSIFDESIIIIDTYSLKAISAAGEVKAGTLYSVY